MKRTSILALLLLVAGIGAPAGAIGPHCCNSCGCSSARKVCKLVPAVTKTTTWCYSIKCDDFCLNGHSRCVGHEQVCDCRGSHCEKVMQPTCCEVMTRRLVQKVPVVKEKHGWKCVVETVCCGCGGCCGEREATETEAQAAIQRATELGADPAVASDELYVPLETVAAPAAASKVVQTSFFSNLFKTR